jgi:hypothetical protein
MARQYCNVLLICFEGLAVGCTAGWIAKTKGMLIAALANFLPLILFIGAALIVNRDLFAYSDTHFETQPALWTWISLVPAMIAGHFAVRIVQQGGSAALTQVLAVIFSLGFKIGATAMHLYTTYIAYKGFGLLAAFLTFGAPPFAEAYWLFAIWNITGAFNIYTLRLLGLAAIGLIGLVMLWISASLSRRAEMRQSIPPP